MQKLKSDFLNALSERGLLHQCTNLPGLDARLTNGTPVSAYLGTDPTADALHVGHLASFGMLRLFAKFGGRPVILVGGATGMIGDADKLSERPMLDEATLAKNVAGLKRDLSKLFNFQSGATLVNNYDWFKGIGYIEFLRDVGRHFTINEMLKKESVKIRLERELPLSFLEFNYSLLQAYDFVHLHKAMGVDLQMFGADQWGNVVAGVSLGRKMLGAELFGLSCPLVVDSQGKKLGKSDGNAVWLDGDRTSDLDYYQYFRNTNDADVGKMLRIFTDLPISEILKLETLSGSEINDAKKILATEATKIIRGEKSAATAATAAESLFSGGDAGAPEVSITATPDTSLMDIIVLSNLAESKSEARRLIEQGGITINHDKKITDPNTKLSDITTSTELLIQKGKKTFIKIKCHPGA
ncbi:MAG: tyrosine--tRNA ligase [Rickettsiales bacterium]|jgi:tyrosyl-tRNA synthetase|nr:tyrosine--tRNA ligase [Rickettsiales bacterium]